MADEKIVIVPVDLSDDLSVAEMKLVLKSLIVQVNELIKNSEGLLPGGLTGQVLTKISDADYDANWQDPQGGGGGTGNHAELTHLDYASSGHTGFLAADGIAQNSLQLNGRKATDFVLATDPRLPLIETAVQAETDPTVPNWAKQQNKPSYNAAEVGAATPAELTAGIAGAKAYTDEKLTDYDTSETVNTKMASATQAANTATDTKLENYDLSTVVTEKVTTGTSTANAYTDTKLTDYLTETEVRDMIGEGGVAIWSDMGSVATRANLPTTSADFKIYHITDENVDVYSRNINSVLTWEPLNAGVDLTGYETVAGATEKMNSAEQAAKTYTDTKLEGYDTSTTVTSKVNTGIGTANAYTDNKVAGYETLDGATTKMTSAVESASAYADGLVADKLGVNDKAADSALLDGKPATDFLGVLGTAEDAKKLGGVNAANYALKADITTGAAVAFSIQAESWSASTVYPEYLFQADLLISGLLASDLVRADFNPASLIIAANAEVMAAGDTDTDVATLYAKTQPTGVLSGVYTVTKGAI